MTHLLCYDCMFVVVWWLIAVLWIANGDRLIALTCAFRKYGLIISYGVPPVRQEEYGLPSRFDNRGHWQLR
jgi:hypothetical protein